MRSDLRSNGARCAPSQPLLPGWASSSPRRSHPIVHPKLMTQPFRKLVGCEWLTHHSSGRRQWPRLTKLYRFLPGFARLGRAEGAPGEGRGRSTP